MAFVKHVSGELIKEKERKCLNGSDPEKCKGSQEVGCAQ